PVAEVNVWLETEPGKKLIAFQQTGESGSVSFAYLDKGVYKIYLEIPVQKDTAVEHEVSAAANFQVGYHSKKMMLFFQNPSGNFIVNFSDAENLFESNLTPMHETESAESNSRVAICKFEVTGKYGKLSLRLSALSVRKFQKQLKKYEHDVGMALISV
ncbi:MAG: hypothetical protein ACP5D9_16480, partial [Mariniphaga sp.]